MPANLTPQYRKAEEAFRRATTAEEQLLCLEQMLREIPKHKGTDKLQAELKGKISRTRQEIEAAKKLERKGNAAQAKIPLQGAGRAILIGAPNAGKSQLLASLTRATPAIAPYPFTTREPQPGMMTFEDIRVQLLDTPPITSDVLEASLLGLIREADLALLVVDVGNDEGLEGVQEVVQKLRGTKTRLANRSYFDATEVGVSYTRTLLVANKCDLPNAAERLTLLPEFCPLEILNLAVSALAGTGLDELRAAIFQGLNVVRVYTKLPTAKEPDFERPFTLKADSTLLDVAELVHHDLAANFKHARVWGTTIPDGGTVFGDYVVHDRDVVEIHT